MTTEEAEVTTKRKTGRPKGATTATHPVVFELNATCPTCGSSERSKKRNDKPVYHAHGGRRYKIIRARVQCTKCGQHYAILSKYDVT